jgi:predicted phosphoribosyltransferase
MTRYADRREAGRRLGEALRSPAAAWRAGVVVLGLPRGGVPVAAEVARALAAPLDVLIVRKVGAPGNPEFAIGAIAEGEVVVRDPRVGGGAWFGERAFEIQAARERVELQRRAEAYRGDRAAPALAGHTALLVDDGLATGATMLAAVRAARRAGAARVVVAVPVCSREARALVAAEADEVIALQVPADFAAVGEWYLRFEQVADAEVVRLLSDARAASA